MLEALLTFKIRAGAFYKVKIHEEQPSGLTPDKTKAASFFERLERHPWKSVGQ